MRLRSPSRVVPNFISEDQIEQALVQKLQHVHGYDMIDCHTEEREDLADRILFKAKCDEVLTSCSITPAGGGNGRRENGFRHSS